MAVLKKFVVLVSGPLKQILDAVSFSMDGFYKLDMLFLIDFFLAGFMAFVLGVF